MILLLPLLLTACLKPLSKDDTGASVDTPSDTVESGDSGDTVPDTGPVDADGDGAPARDDCNDIDPDVHPDAQEVVDGADNDCDGKTDEEPWLGDVDVNRNASVLTGASDTTTYLGAALQRNPGDAASETDGFVADGIPDILVAGAGAERFSTNPVHAVWLVRGRTAAEYDRSISAMDGLVFQPLTEETMFGATVDFVDDQDGDDVPEVLIGSPSDGRLPGIAYLFRSRGWDANEYGLLTTTSASLTLWAHVTGSDEYGMVTALGDIDDNGMGDFAVGDPSGDDWAGQIQVFLGEDGVEGADLGANAASTLLSGGTDSEMVGISRPALVDLDGDGGEDVVFAHPYTYDRIGLIRVVLRGEWSPREKAELQDIGDIVTVDTDAGTVGAAMTTGADFDNDGTDDLAITAGRYSDYTPADPYVLLISGAALLKTHDLADSQIGRVGPLSLAVGVSTLALGAADWNTDGYGDIAAFDNPDNMESGAVALFYGHPDMGTVDTPDALFAGDEGDRLGYSVVSGQDVTGDDTPEILIGAHTWGNAGAGALLVFSPPPPEDW